MPSSRGRLASATGPRWRPGRVLGNSHVVEGCGAVGAGAGQVCDERGEWLGEFQLVSSQRDRDGLPVAVDVGSGERGDACQRLGVEGHQGGGDAVGGVDGVVGDEPAGQRPAMLGVGRLLGLAVQSSLAECGIVSQGKPGAREGSARRPGDGRNDQQTSRALAGTLQQVDVAAQALERQDAKLGRLRGADALLDARMLTVGQLQHREVGSCWSVVIVAVVALGEVVPQQVRGRTG
jgi:hypothetical protein